MVFVAFTQHCIQSNVTHVTHVRGVKGVLCIQWPLTPARRVGSLSLPSWGFSSSPPVSLRRQLLTFLDLSTTRVITGKMHSHYPILKTKGVLSNPVILRYLQTKLHPPNCQTACLVYEFRSKKCLQCLRNVGLYNSFGLSRFSFWQSWLHKQVDLPIHRLQLGYQLPHTHPSLIAHTWPIFDQSRSCSPCEPPAQLTNKLVLA